MANWIDCTLDVLATDPKEINDISNLLQKPSTEFLIQAAETAAEMDERTKAILARSEAAETVAEIDKIEKEVFVLPTGSLVRSTGARPPDDAEINSLRELVAFKAVSNLGYVHESVNKARRFQNSFKDHSEDPIYMYLCQVSIAFPSAIFLIDHRNMEWSCAWKKVMRNGVVEQAVGDTEERAQLIEWMLLDIFAPFRAEYENGQPFGSLWNDWVDDLVAAANGLRNLPRSMSCTEKIP